MLAIGPEVPVGVLIRVKFKRKINGIDGVAIGPEVPVGVLIRVKFKRKINRIDGVSF